MPERRQREERERGERERLTDILILSSRRGLRFTFNPFLKMANAK